MNTAHYSFSSTVFTLLFILTFWNTTDIIFSFSHEFEGPIFIKEPPPQLIYVNIKGSLLDCIANGNPIPKIEWVEGDYIPVGNIPKIRQVLSNGSLYFLPFDNDSFKKDAQWKIYKCIASNSAGKIVSRDVVVKTVIDQRFEPEVQNPGGFIGSSILMKCNIPSVVKDYVKITSWLQEPSFNIYPTLESDGKYHMLPNGDLLIINITRTDTQKSYRCRSHHKLTEDAVISSSAGHILITEMREPVPPIMNTKLIQMHVKIGDTVAIPCVAYATPRPTFRWYIRKNGRDDVIDKNILSRRITVVDDITLKIRKIQESDEGTYFCTATNTEGSETLEVEITITQSLKVHVQPSQQTVDLGKQTSLTCHIEGMPVKTIWWLKDGQTLRTGSRVRLISKDHVRITSVAKEDRGMYQCFAKNDYESAQGITELTLGQIEPNFVYKFIAQTIPPGPSVSLKCTGTGNPTPQIFWKLDGLALQSSERLVIGQYVTVSGDVISHVNITAVKTEDGGEYECIAKSRAGVIQHSARLNIYGPPSIRTIPPISAVAGKTLILKCPVSGYPIESITWEKDGATLPINMLQSVANGTLTIDNVQRTADQGSYVCIAKGKESQSAHRSVEVNVLVPPKITPFTFARDLNVGDRTSVQCVVVTGDLPLTFVWLKDNITIVNSSGVINNDVSDSITIRQYDDFTSALSIINISKSQGGIYTCHVQNEASSVFYSANLKVNVPPRISPFNFEDDIQEGMRTQLMCSSSQGDQPFNITWLRNGEILNNNNINKENTININEYPPFLSILAIHNVTSQHNGNYTCEINNLAGTVDHTAILSVSVPPRWLIEPQDESAVLGTSIAITCTTDGFPLPIVKWKQGIGQQRSEYREIHNDDGIGSGNNSEVRNEKIERNHAIDFIEDFNNGTLFIRKVNREHEGYFLCQANNGIGSGLSKLIHLKVHAGPKVKIRNKQVSVRRGEKITLRCEADGDAPLEIAWRLNNNRIEPLYDIRYHIKKSDYNRGIVSDLTIAQTTLNDRGEYTCIATNSYGHDHLAVFVLIQEPPSFPRNLHATELGSRSIILAWSPGDSHDGSNLVNDNQQITSYILQYKESNDVWHEHNSQKLVPGEKTIAYVDFLKPASDYHFRIYAANNLGKSAPSDILHIHTESEIPNGPPLKITVEPLGSQQLLVTWRPPEREFWNGDLLGYTIGYHRVDNKEKTYNYTKIGIPGGEGVSEFRLTGLEKFTQYSVTVQAFNAKGDGPASEPVIARTLEDAPSASPQKVTCLPLAALNIQVSWNPPPQEEIHGSIQGYKLIYEAINLENEYGGHGTKITSALSTVLHGLHPYTNYTVQVLAFTRAGEGVLSNLITCTTDETVPDAPERVKSVASSETSVVISWLPPQHPNGILTKYTIFIRILDKGQELRIIRDSLSAHNHHYEAKNLNSRETYEAWVTASTAIGQGPSTPVIKLIPTSNIPAAIISFGQILSVSWKIDVKLVCLYVGVPLPSVEWRVGDSRTSSNIKIHRLEIGNDNTLTVHNVQKIHQGNYTCSARNPHGADHITYQLFVQVPPSTPELSASSSTTSSVALTWQNGDTGGAKIRGFRLFFRYEFGEWEDMMIDRNINSYLMEQLQCGTRYQFKIISYNKIGISNPSNIETIQTKGSIPIQPKRQYFIRINITSIILELSAWQDGGCPISYFTVEFRRYNVGHEFIVVSSNVAPQARFPINDLEPATTYNLRITAHNNAGTTVAEYVCETLNIAGVIGNAEPGNGITLSDAPVSYKKYLFTIAITMSVVVVFIFIICCWTCCKSHKSQQARRNRPPTEPLEMQQIPDSNYQRNILTPSVISNPISSPSYQNLNTSPGQQRQLQQFDRQTSQNITQHSAYHHNRCNDQFNRDSKYIGKSVNKNLSNYNLTPKDLPKCYSDILTVTPRRKGKRISNKNTMTSTSSPPSSWNSKELIEIIRRDSNDIRKILSIAPENIVADSLYSAETLRINEDDIETIATASSRLSLSSIPSHKNYFTHHQSSPQVMKKNDKLSPNAIARSAIKHPHEHNDFTIAV